MEVFAIADIQTTPEQLQQLSVDKLNEYCADIEKVLHVEHENSSSIYCIWGEFTVHRQLINGGVRFSMPTCPNAFVWTITTGFDPAPEKVVIHGTINRTDHDADFIESIALFLDAWKAGLKRHFVDAG